MGVVVVFFVVLFFSGGGICGVGLVVDCVGGGC